MSNNDGDGCGCGAILMGLVAVFFLLPLLPGAIVATGGSIIGWLAALGGIAMLFGILGGGDKK